jgi:hypothetical protein
VIAGRCRRRAREGAESRGSDGNVAWLFKTFKF